MLHLGIADNSTIVPIQFFLTSSSPLASGNISTLDLELVIPSFSSSFHYDPDFSVTLIGANNGGDGGNNLLPLLALIGLVIPVAFVLLSVVVCVFFVVRKRRRMTSSAQVVNFKNEEEINL